MLSTIIRKKESINEEMKSKAKPFFVLLRYITILKCVNECERFYFDYNFFFLLH